MGIMSSLWQHQFYYLFGFLALVLCILIVTCAEISIALTYFQLTSEDYNWWWRSFFSSASSAIYVFLYSILYQLEAEHGQARVDNPLLRIHVLDVPRLLPLDWLHRDHCVVLFRAGDLRLDQDRLICSDAARL